jgi:hypothetical protein
MIGRFTIASRCDLAIPRCIRPSALMCNNLELEVRTSRRACQVPTRTPPSLPLSAESVKSPTR